MNMVVSGDVFVVVAMGGFVFAVDVGMGMDMGMFMGMGIAVVLMGVGVTVGMVVVEGDGVFDHQHRSGDHEGKSHKKLDTGFLLQKQHAKENTQKRGNGGTRPPFC